MRTNLNSTSMRNTCPEFPLFGANYPDATCIDGILYDLDNVGDDGVLIKPLEEIPCPFCRTEEFIRYDPFNKEYSMDSENEGHEPRDMAGGSGASPRRAMDAGRRGTGVFLWIDRG